MANEEKTMRDDFDDGLTDEGLRELFLAFDEVRASETLQESTISAILEASGTDQAPTVQEAQEADVKAFAGGRQTKSARQTKWRAIRVAAIAACLVLALGGGAAYATPASYYEVAQGDTTITLGVNCFGMTVSAESDTDEGSRIIQEAQLGNRPYAESIDRAVEAMGQREPAEPIEFGPKDGDHERVEASAPETPGRQGETPGEASSPAQGQPQPSGDEPNGAGEPANSGNPPDSAPEGTASASAASPDGQRADGR